MEWRMLTNRFWIRNVEDWSEEGKVEFGEVVVLVGECSRPGRQIAAIYHPRLQGIYGIPAVPPRVLVEHSEEVCIEDV